MEDEALEIIYDQTKKKRVTIFRKKTGTFYYEEEYFREDSEEMWLDTENKANSWNYDSRAKDQTEAQANTQWLKNI